MAIPSLRQDNVANLLALGEVTVGPAIRPVDMRTLPPHIKDNARFQYISLVAHTWDPRAYEPNDVLHIDAYWRLEEPTPRDHVLSIELVPTHAAAEPSFILGATDLATASWPVGQMIRSQHNLLLPPDIPPGSYALRARLQTAGEPAEALLVKPSWWAQERPWLTLGQVSVRQPTTPTLSHGSRPSIQNPMDIKLSDGIAFLGYELPTAKVTAGEELLLILYWECTGAMETSYAVFTHVIDHENRIWGQKDNVPVEARRPTSGWQVGEVITDHYRIPVKAETAPGSYVLTVGMYDPETMDRLPPRDSHGNPLPWERIELQAIQVTR